MNQGYRKYKPFVPIGLQNRTWPDQVLCKAPVWCSVDLRDGNQALVNPMNLEQKVEFFQMLTSIGFREIEVGFPASSETEYEILRTLIEQDLIPPGVTIQVLVQAREHLIRRTFEAIRGAKDVIIHFYNSTSTLQRKVVFPHGYAGGHRHRCGGGKAHPVPDGRAPGSGAGMRIRYEYSPESFSGTEMENAVLICDRVLEELGATPENQVIINLPNTVEMCTPNTYADQVEYVCRNLRHRDSAIISLHPHNDRGTAVAATELGLMAGAQRVEGTLFGNGERTGNVDIMNLALNLYSQGVDPGLDFSHMNQVKQVYEESTQMTVPPRHPYAGNWCSRRFPVPTRTPSTKGWTTWPSTPPPIGKCPTCPSTRQTWAASTSPLSGSTASRARAVPPLSCGSPLAISCPRPCTRSSAPW